VTVAVSAAGEVIAAGLRRLLRRGVAGVPDRLLVGSTPATTPFLYGRHAVSKAAMAEPREGRNVTEQLDELRRTCRRKGWSAWRKRWSTP